jgi:hypothetical protein
MRAPVERQLDDGSLVAKSNGMLKGRGIRALWETSRRESAGSEKISFKK